MTTVELKEYYEATRDDNEVSFDKWCLDHEWVLNGDSWFLLDEVQAIVDYCQPENSSWVGEWMLKNAVNEINEHNVFDYIYDEIDNPESFIEEILENLVD